MLINYLQRRDILNLPKPKQKLNKRQQNLWTEWLQKDQEILAEFDKLEVGQLSNGLVQKQRQLQKKYFKLIREAADEHS